MWPVRSDRRISSVDDPFAIFIAVDDKHPDAYAIRLAQAGLGLPDRDYYLRPDSALAATRTAYQKYLAAMLTDAGQTDVEKRAAAVYELEHQIAEASWPAADRRDADKTYNPVTVSELEKLAPQFPWRTVFTGLGIPLTSHHGDRAVIVTEKSAFPKLAAVYARTPVPVWRDYFTTHYLHANAGLLDRKTDSINFDFYGKVLSGQQQQRSREIRAFYRVDGMLGEALGKLYVAKYFPPDAKAKAMTLVNLMHQVGHGGRHQVTRLDDGFHQDAGAGKAVEVQHQDRLPRQMARLHRPCG